MAHLDPLPVRLCLGGLPVTVQELLRHLLACPDCREALGPWPAPEPAPETTAAEEADRGERLDEIAAAAAELAEERQRCAALVPLLLEAPAAAWPALLATYPEARSVGFLRELLERPRTASDPGEDVHRALLALEALLGLGEEPAIPRAVVLDLRVQALTLLAEAHLAAGAWCTAQTAYDSASRLLSEDLGSSEEASFALSLARAMGNEGRYVEALALADRAADLHARLGDLPRECAACQLAGSLYVQVGDLEAALAPYARALLAAEASGESAALAAGVRRCLAWVLLIDGRGREAFEILADTRVEDSPPPDRALPAPAAPQPPVASPAEGL
jgi:tetratricopeptide (TPR) repeat protein